MIKGDDLRYSRLGDIIQIVFRMQGTQIGLTLEEIADELNATRRTAERIRDAILRNFPQIGEIPSKNNYKRWGITNWQGRRAFLSGLIGFTENEILELEQLKKLARQRGNMLRGKNLKNILNKIKALMHGTVDSDHFRADNLKLLIESEGFAVSQFIRQNLDPNMLAVIRTGFRTSAKLIFNYTNRRGEKSRRVGEPYGLLYNHENYLVAKDDVIKLFDLSRIENLELGDSFTRDEAFSLEEFASRSFGVYQETPQEVKLFFDQSAAANALKYHFHPSQEIRLRESGEVEVYFKAGGSVAMLRELFKWGAHVRILEPQSLKETYAQELQKILAAQGS